MGNLKILLFDLDGTLLRNDKTVSEYSLEILSKCKECGHFIGISTSRSEQNCFSFLKEVKPDILISSGGALVRVNEKIICSSSFSVRETNSFIESVRKICWGDSIYTDFTDFPYEALKICVEIPHPGLAQKLCEHFSELDSQRFSDGDWYKFTKSGVTKEKAILAVCEACHIDISETVAFGDDYADIGMLKICGIGVAMGNAVQEVKDIADDITLSNEEDGVAAYLEKWII